VSRWRSWTLLILVAAAFSGGTISIFDREFAAGDIYPEFSSLRTGRGGTELLFDSLRKLPGIAVERNFLPMEFLPHDGVTLVLLGVKPLQVNWNEARFLESVEQIASRGNRVVVAMHLHAEITNLAGHGFDRRKDPETAVAPIQTMWKVSLDLDSTEKTPHQLYFGQAAGWTVRDKVGSKTLAIEREFGKGSVLLMAESADFRNESVAALDRLQQASAALGPYRRIVFDEEHLGLKNAGSVMEIARHFHLLGMAFGLGLCAALFIWRSAASFPPPAPSSAVQPTSGRTSQAGLFTLLQRHIPTSQLAAVCWSEWLRTNGLQATSELRKQAEAILAGASKRPVEATREIQDLIRPKGKS
jgi:hypothetical protein